MLRQLIWRLVALLMLGTGLIGASPPHLSAAQASAVDQQQHKFADRIGEQVNEKGKDKEKDKDKPGKDKDKPIAEVAEYVVEVDCQFDADANSTTCTFAGVTPEGGKKIGYAILSEDAVCADVVDGDFEYVAPDPQTEITRFKSTGSSATFTLVFDGEVGTSGSTTYWIKAANSIFPAMGPGLICREQADDASTQESPSDDATAATTDRTGSIIVTTYTCPEVPEDPGTFDWFGACHLTDGTVNYTVENIDVPTDELVPGEPGGTGETTFDALPPGTYHLDLIDLTWCHAESDTVDDAGELIIDGVEGTNVWIFLCDSAAGS